MVDPVGKIARGREKSNLMEWSPAPPASKTNPVATECLQRQNPPVTPNGVVPVTPETALTVPVINICSPTLSHAQRRKGQ
ncbi:hypothetical protein ACFX15_023523 [Malus domestica]